MIPSPTTTNTIPGSRMQLPSEIIKKAFDIYFESIHRQPLWLFESDSCLSPDTSEELVCVILALAITYSPVELSGTDLQSPEFYSQTARRLIMLKVADDEMSLSTHQALCLLAFFNLICKSPDLGLCSCFMIDADIPAGDLSQAGLNIAFVKNTAQYSGLKQEYPSGHPTTQEQSRIFWSITLLDSFYGPPILIPELKDFHNPRFSTVQSRQISMPCPPLPSESQVRRRQTLPDIWSHMLRICNLWGEVRLYVSRCIDGLTDAPWQPNSGYNTICSRLLDLEVEYPSSLSYNNVKFQDSPIQELHEDRLKWLPWLRVQMAYHAIHCVLNHPFLYSFKGTKQRMGNTTFWRASCEKALQHSTWICRLIREASEKRFELADPFFAQVAAIAGTLHLYWTATSNPGLQASAEENLRVCRNLIAVMATRWPVCKSIERDLNQLISLVGAFDPKSEAELIQRGVQTSLMWILLDVAAPQFPTYADDAMQNKGLWRTGNNSREYTSLESPDIYTHSTEMEGSTNQYISPADWVSSRFIEDLSPSGTQRGGPNMQQPDSSSFNFMTSARQEGMNNPDLTWGPWQHMMRIGDNSIAGSDWWSSSNL
ncbi:unnamed protein product [Clonostachys byssicola]|uniref:Transcription factor domain-containing protein n=1 Tax=Clonostachys byssicola TaxID=160290 RepID=A0A9N9UCM8_9HYPO|nr:unnamed protein product [Clonostachys byssicola]